MRFLKRWIRNWINTDYPDYNLVAEAKTVSCTVSNNLEPNYTDSDVITFKLHKASGGRVIETFRYDQRASDSKRSLYVIEDSQDFTESLSRIITLEYLK